LRLRHRKLKLRQLDGIDEQAAKPARNFKIHYGPFHPHQPRSVFPAAGWRAPFLSRISDIEKSNLFVQRSKYRKAGPLRTGTMHHCSYVKSA
jgi:hypothetical protein